jgi:hypothetical protein
MRRVLIGAVCLGVAACSATPAPKAGSVPDRCASAAKGDPAEMSLCLASHHIVVRDSVRGCVKGERDRSKLIECLREAAQ